METPSTATGQRYGYHWVSIRSSASSLLYLLLIDIPEIVLNRLVAITSFDSGPLTPSQEELARGWHRVGDVLWTDRVSDEYGLPYSEWDEWYVFEEEVRLAPIEVLVNYSDFCLEDPSEILKANRTWDKNLFDHQLQLQEVFWEQMRTYGPFAFLAQNDCSLNFATKDAVIARRVAQWCQHRAGRAT